MPKFKVLGGTWGEGYELGQIIELDTDAAARRIELGEIELVVGPVSVSTPEIEVSEPDNTLEKPKRVAKK